MDDENEFDDVGGNDVEDGLEGEDGIGGQYRHVHVYAAAEFELLPNAEEMIKPYTIKKTKSKEQNDKDRAAYEEEQRDKLLKRHDATRITRIKAIVFDFINSTSRSDLAVPRNEDRVFMISVDSKSQFPSFTFLKTLDKELAGGEYLDTRRVAFRAKEGGFLRHAIRIDAMRAATAEGVPLLSTSGINPSLYYSNPTFSWTSVTGPAKSADIENLLKQFPIHIDKEDPLDVELQTTLQLYALAGFCCRYSF